MHTKDGCMHPKSDACTQLLLDKHKHTTSLELVLSG